MTILTRLTRCRDSAVCTNILEGPNAAAKCSLSPLSRMLAIECSGLRRGAQPGCASAGTGDAA